jgi:dipeptidyl aminopeptidase/acylaminoacyl peptidase
MRRVPAVHRVLTLSMLIVLAGRAPVLAQGGASASGFTMDDVLTVKNTSLGDASADGRWAVVTTSSLRDRLGSDNSRFGDPTYVSPGLAEISVIDTQTGEVRRLFPDARQARSFAWSPDGAQLAFLLREGDTFRLMIWERERSRFRSVSPPAGRIIAESATLDWTADSRSLLFSLRTLEWQREARERFVRETMGPIVVQSSTDPFLSWEEIRRRSMIQIPAIFNLETGRLDELLPESRLGNFFISHDGTTFVYEEDIVKKTDYAEIGGREGKLMVRQLGGGEPRVLVPSTKGVTFRWSEDGRAYVYAKDGKVFFGTTLEGEPRKLTGEDPPKPGEEPADSAARVAEREHREKERFTPVRLDKTGNWMIATNKEGFWLIDTATGQQRTMFQAMPQQEGDRTSPRYSVVAWSDDGNDIYLSYNSRTAWERGIIHYDRRTNQKRELIKDDRYYSGIRLSADGQTMVLSIARGNHPGDLFVSDNQLSNPRQLTQTNPGIESKLSRTQLIKYFDVDGDELNGIVYYPLNYQPGTRVPTIFIVYEEFFDDRFNATVNFLTSNGYAVVQPSVDLERGFPGEAWMKGVTAAANKLVEMGVADPKRLGVHGTSYGGYATNLLVTQTNRFAAAINISGKTDMISFYTDSPRLGTRNIHAPERSQDRIGATLWEQPQKYIAHSAVMAADRITTPLLLLTGREDHNVPERTTSEMFYALRRLGKRVEWVSYINGGHGMPTTTEEEVRDFHARILNWYDKYLKGGSADRRVTQS